MPSFCIHLHLLLDLLARVMFLQGSFCCAFASLLVAYVTPEPVWLACAWVDVTRWCGALDGFNVPSHANALCQGCQM